MNYSPPFFSLKCCLAETFLDCCSICLKEGGRKQQLQRFSEFESCPKTKKNCCSCNEVANRKLSQIEATNLENSSCCPASLFASSVFTRFLFRAPLCSRSPRRSEFRDVGCESEVVHVVVLIRIRRLSSVLGEKTARLARDNFDCCCCFCLQAFEGARAMLADVSLYAPPMMGY